MRSLLPILLLIPASIAQHSRAFPGPNNSVEQPQCPNGETPKMDKQGALIQCLPGAGQHSVCGPVHTCFFSGMNYMCCPTNEPPADAPPVCPNGLMTVTDARNHVVRCIPGRKACPAGGQLCLHTGREREHVCCQKFLARPATPKPERRPIDSGDDEIVTSSKVSCPAKSLAVLANDGNTIECSASEPCPGASHICFGTTKRAICCQEQATKHISLASGVSMVDHTSGHASDAAAKAVKETVKEGLKRKSIKERGKVDKRQQFLEAVQPSSPVQSLNDGEMTQKPVRRIKKVRKTTASTTTTTTASPEEYEYYYVDENGKEETTTAEPTTTTTTEATTTTRKIRRRKIKTTTASTEEAEEAVEAVEETVTEAQRAPEIIDPVLEKEDKQDKSYESGETIFKNRPRAQEIDANAITEPQFARARARSAKTLTGPIQPNTEGRKQMAQKYIMRHIRNGWPYNENYYRPDVTDAPAELPVFVQ